MEMIKTKF